LLLFSFSIANSTSEALGSSISGSALCMVPFDNPKQLINRHQFGLLWVRILLQFYFFLGSWIIYLLSPMVPCLYMQHMYMCTETTWQYLVCKRKDPDVILEFELAFFILFFFFKFTVCTDSILSRVLNYLINNTHTFLISLWLC
jgi:hypothetical protein